jgi:hypothetical protein
MTTNHHVANIGDRGVRRRRNAGIAFCVFAAAVLIVLLIIDASSWWRLLVGIPAGLGAAELLEARDKT